MKKALILIIGTMFIVNTYSQDKLVESNNEFAFKIYKATKPDSANFFISPFSLNIALSMANEGAKSNTRQEMDRLLSIQDIGDRAPLYNNLIQKTTDTNDPMFKKCNKLSKDTTGRNSLYLANSLWINEKFRIDNNYKKTIEQYYHSDIFSFNKHNIPSANLMLNDWISDKTNGKINQISGLDGSIMLSIVNAIYFKGEWDTPFEEIKTTKLGFHTINKKKIDIKFMQGQADYRYFEDNEIQSILLPYKCRQFSMLIILPRERFGIMDIEKKLDPDYLKKINQLSYSHEVVISLPRFKIESEIQPREAIIKMGCPGMFSDRADFTKMSEIDSLKVSRIIHKTYIEIDEKKTEAVAVTKVDMRMTTTVADPHIEPPKIFNADHPFIFLIVDNRTHAILFTGRFVNIEP